MSGDFIELDGHNERGHSAESPAAKLQAQKVVTHDQWAFDQ